MGKIVEICCADIAAIDAAKAGGANRIELCSGIEEGGLTPSFALISYALDSKIPEVNILLRPRPGDFLYSEKELKMIEEEIVASAMIGTNGFVFGMLTPEGEVDIKACRKLVAIACLNAAVDGKPKPRLTFHRAFDVCRDPMKALEDIIDLGFDCLLTSGQQPTAEEGIPMLKKIAEAAKGRIEIIAGSGVNPDNAARIIKETGVDGVHSTARKHLESGMTHRNEKIGFGEDRLETSTDVVAKLLHNAKFNA